ncbi:hypothetical protein ECFDA504_2939, partial [Escherichia coli FDA504]
LMRRAAGN